MSKNSVLGTNIFIPFIFGSFIISWSILNKFYNIAITKIVFTIYVLNQ